MIPAMGNSLKGIKYVDEAALLKYGDEVVSMSKGTIKDTDSKAKIYVLNIYHLLEK